MTSKLSKYNDMIDELITESNRAAAGGVEGIEINAIIRVFKQVHTMLGAVSQEGYELGFSDGKAVSNSTKH